MRAKSEDRTKHTTSEWVYRRIHRAIVSGEIPGGLELREVALAKEYQVSRTPVREALRRLATDGLVKNYPNRGSTVVNLTKKDTLEIYQVRELLEVGSARLAAERIDREQITELRKLITMGYVAEGELSDDAVDRLMDQDERFHFVIATASQCERLKSEIFRCMQQVRQVRQMVQVRHEVWSRGGWVKQAVHDHERIADAIEEGDGEAAAALMAWHIRSSRQFLADAFDELGIDQ